MAWFCKKCTDAGIMESEWSDANENGIVFDIKEEECVGEICEGCGGGYFDRYGYPVQTECEDDICNEEDHENFCDAIKKSKLNKDEPIN